MGERVGEVEIKESKWIEYLGRVSDQELTRLYSQARGFIALAHDEDFGMTVVEAIAQGTPVLAYNGGGYKETVKEGVNGWLLESSDSESVVRGITKMEQTKWDLNKIIESARPFSRENFISKFKKVVEQ